MDRPNEKATHDDVFNQRESDWEYAMRRAFHHNISLTMNPNDTDPEDCKCEFTASGICKWCHVKAEKDEE